MSIEAIHWALNHALIPTDRRDSSSLAIVLVGLANHADTLGRNAFPSVATLTRYTRLSERSVRYALRGLVELGVIRPADPAVVAAYITRSDRRPIGYDLVMDGLTGVQTMHPATSDEGQTLHPEPVHEVQTLPNGVQTTTPRGAELAPEPSFNQQKNHPTEQRAPRASEREARTLVNTWHRSSGHAYRRTVLDGLQREVAALLDDEADPELIPTALNDWHQRGRTPAFLRHCYDDALKPPPESARSAKIARTMAAGEELQRRLDGLPPSGRGDKMRGWAALGAGLQADLDRLPTTDRRVAEAMALRERLRDEGRLVEETRPNPIMKLLEGGQG